MPDKMNLKTLRHLIMTLSILGMGITPPLLSTDEELATAENVVSSLLTRVSELEDQNRTLKGAHEEAQHTLQEMQRKLETALSDVEMRLNALEGATPAAKTATTTPAPITPTAAEATLGKEELPLPLGEKAAKDNSGNLMGTLGSKDAPTGTAPVESAQDSSAESQYEKARALLEGGDYEAAEKAFTAFVRTYPKDSLAGKAQYWLGVTYYVRNDYEKAAAAFAKGYKTYGKSDKAPDMLFKLAKSLEAMNRNADACKALVEMRSSYPDAQKTEVAKLMTTLSCQN